MNKIRTIQLGIGLILILLSMAGPARVYYKVIYLPGGDSIVPNLLIYLVSLFHESGFKEGLFQSFTLLLLTAGVCLTGYTIIQLTKEDQNGYTKSFFL